MTIMQNQPSTVRTVYQFQCCVCLSVMDQEWTGAKRAYPCHPGKGWQQIGVEFGPSLWICPAHKVVITVDGAELNTAGESADDESTDGESASACPMCVILHRPCSAHGGGAFQE